MANILKFKLGVSFFSLCVLALIPLLESNFYASATIKRWGRLDWSDFQGIAKPFTGYGAAIYSDVYLEYDSLNNRFHAYAGQNNILSWTKESTAESAYALNHEQYHFNITELHARKMNEYIKTNPERSEAHYRYRLAIIRAELDIMQDEYDGESDHSLIKDQQRKWEYKIDSLLLLHSNDSGWVDDYYSRARIYFPDKPEFFNGINEDFSAYREYSLARYNMLFSLTSFQYQEYDLDHVEERLRKFYSNHALNIKSFLIEVSNEEFRASLVLKDTLGCTTHHLWAYDRPYLYKISAIYPDNQKDTIGYYQIASSFIGSFKVIGTDKY